MIRPRFIAAAFTGAALLVACGGAPPSPAKPPGRATAGQDRCIGVKDHDRPFIVVSESTDLASLESQAQRDVVFVKYVGCELTVLECGDSKLAGAHGAYRAPRRTSGGVERIDIESEQELFSTLPLASGSLSAKVAAGASLHLRYQVSGTTVANRTSIYAGEIAGNEGCSAATHFVQAYDFGAFELSWSARGTASTKIEDPNGERGGSRRSDLTVIKKAGQIETCASPDGSACRVPLRLVVRALEPGQRPAGAPE